MNNNQFLRFFFLILYFGFTPKLVTGQTDTLDYLQDRGVGVMTSLFGTYIEKKDFIVYPFYEYYFDKKTEYIPEELGFSSDQAFDGKSTAHEGLIYLGYGITDWLMLELETSLIKVTQNKSSDDSTNMPATFTESGMETFETQLRWKYCTEKRNRPEVYSYFHTDFAVQGDHKMIGEEFVQLAFGVGLIKGFRFGTISTNVAIDYDTGPGELAIGGWTVEYLKKINDHFRIYVAFEGIPDETEFITEVQIFPVPWMFIRLNNAIGISPEATDIAPEIGVLMYVNRIRK